MCDTELTRDALEALWRDDPALPGGETTAREVLVWALGELPPFDTRLAAWTGRLAALEDPTLKASAARVLARTATAETWAVLDAWVDDPDPTVSVAARAELEAERVRAQRAADLVAGRITPDDLLPPATPCVWDGERCVAEG